MVAPSYHGGNLPVKHKVTKGDNDREAPRAYIVAMMATGAISGAPYRRYFREWRKHAGFTQQRLANQLGVSKTQVSRVETGTRRFKEQYLNDFAAAVGCEPCDPISRPPHIPSLDRLVEKLPDKKREQIVKAVVGLVAAEA